MHDVKVNEESVSFFEADDNVAEIAPPFADEQPVNVTPLIVCAVFTDVKANTAPFPHSRLIELNVFVPFTVNFPQVISISASLFVAYDDMHVNVIPFNTRLAVDVIESRELSLDSCAVSVIVNACNVCTPAVAESIQDPLLTLTIVDSADDSQYASIVSFDETLNPVFDEECVDV